MDNIDKHSLKSFHLLLSLLKRMASKCTKGVNTLNSCTPFFPERKVRKCFANASHFRCGKFKLFPSNSASPLEEVHSPLSLLTSHSNLGTQTSYHVTLLYICCAYIHPDYFPSLLPFFDNFANLTIKPEFPYHI